MPRDESDPPFYLIVADHDRGVFAVEGPMTDDRPWNEAATWARNSSIASSAARPARIATRWRQNFTARTSWPVFHRAAS